jgi:hypothetical protein
MKKLIFAFFLATLTSALTFAQNSDVYKKYEFFAGFSNGQVDSGIDSGSSVSSFLKDRANYSGFEIAGVYNVHRYIGIKADFSATFNKNGASFPILAGGGPPQNLIYNAQNSLYNVLGGIQIKDNASKSRFKPFAHALAGIAHKRMDATIISCPPSVLCSSIGGSSTGFAAAFGGGLDIKINDKIDFRAFQVDYNPVRSGGGFDHNVRFGIGLVFK